MAVACAAAAAVSVTIAGQAMSVTRVADAMLVKAPTFTFLDGPVLARLRDGQSVRIDLDLTLSMRPGGSPAATREQGCQVSFDLWEERFAVTRVGTPPRALSHVTARAAESWCLDALAVPLAELGRLGRDTPFWIRLTSRVQNPETVTSGESVFTLGRLVDTLSRRRESRVPERSLEAGPFHLPD